MNKETYMKFMRVGALKSAMRSISDAMLYNEENKELSVAYSILLKEVNIIKARLTPQDKG